jgi:FdhD protein
MKSHKSIRIVRIKESYSEETEDLIAVEKRVAISVNGKNLLNLYCTPLMIREFVVGIINNEGLISGEWCLERMSIDYGEDIRVDISSEGHVYEGAKTITSGCAGGISVTGKMPEKILDDAVFSADSIRKLFREFQKRSEVYRITGGVHSAALTDNENILAFAEDIGRHNAVDKVTGYCILENISFKGRMLLASGRISSDIVLKSARCGIPVIVSRAAPTSLAVEIADKTGLTLVGFMRGERMNVYSGRQRILNS